MFTTVFLKPVFLQSLESDVFETTLMMVFIQVTIIKRVKNKTKVQGLFIYVFEQYGLQNMWKVCYATSAGAGPCLSTVNVMLTLSGCHTGLLVLSFYLTNLVPKKTVTRN